MTDDGLMISSKSREILKRVKHVVPPMLEKFHKGTSRFKYLFHAMFLASEKKTMDKRGSCIVPRLTSIFTGQLGRVAVLGGSQE